jgi:ABC-2 type transport system ATP-binding protein
MLGAMSPAFEVRDVEKRYGRPPRAVHALRGVSLAGEAGQVLGLLGPNGAGKTTTVKLLTGLIRPDAGKAFVLGSDPAEPAARRALGYLPESPALLLPLTGAELVDREGRLHGLPRAERRARTAVLLDRVGLGADVYERRVATFSKGERARVGLALALVGDPRVLFLDEPTDGLDPVGRRAVRDLLRALAKEGRAVMVNSHLLAEVEAVADHVVIIKAGKVVAQGATDALLGGGKAVYRLRLADPLDAAGLAALKARCPGLKGATTADGAGEATLVLPLESADAIDDLLDLVRGKGGRIRELRPRASLEDVFLDLMEAAPAAPTTAAPTGAAP